VIQGVGSVFRASLERQILPRGETRTKNTPDPFPSARQFYAMLENETLWQVARACHETLRAANIPYAVVGGVAVCLHGYQRNTVDLDLLVRAEDATAIRQAMREAGFAWSKESKEFRSPAGVPVQFLMAGERAGPHSEVLLPDPSEKKTTAEVEGLPVVALARLVEMKLACGQGDLRRTHKDFADVVELIAIHQLNRSFARYLHKSLRKTFRELVLRARGES
jgi:hypothetical protein